MLFQTFGNCSRSDRWQASYQLRQWIVINLDITKMKIMRAKKCTYVFTSVMVVYPMITLCLHHHVHQAMGSQLLQKNPSSTCNSKMDTDFSELPEPHMIWTTTWQFNYSWNLELQFSTLQIISPSTVMRQHREVIHPHWMENKQHQTDTEVLAIGWSLHSTWQSHLCMCICSRHDLDQHDLDQQRRLDTKQTIIFFIDSHLQNSS